MNRWTSEQLQAIKARDTAILVSAAAGSGKTSVLVERLLQQLSDTDNRVPADRIVVVTFTNDAAAEMKQRLIISLGRLLEDSPSNLWLSQQQVLLQTAKISTIHSFCFDLIRENVQSLDITYGFRIIDDIEEKVISSKALENVFEEFYEKSPEIMKKLTSFFCIKGDKQLENIIMQLYTFVGSIPFWRDWIEEKQHSYQNYEDIVRWKSDYLQYLSVALSSLKESAIGLVYDADNISATEASYLIQTEADMFEDILNGMNSSGGIIKTWDEVMALFGNLSFGRIKFPKLEKNSAEWEQAERIKKTRDRYKKSFNDICNNRIFTSQDIDSDLTIHYEMLSGLHKLLTALTENIWNQKVEKNAIGFSDAEQLTIGLLGRKNELGGITKTTLAMELSEYYKVIMIDEFQDANNTQDLIFKLISHNGDSCKNGDNMFIVGDVKQSIYSFRLANPSIFIDMLEKSDAYTDGYDGKNAAIRLNRNFRSSRQVVNFVNFIFEKIMTKQNDNIEYTDEEKLVKAAEFDEADRRNTEIFLINKQSDTKYEPDLELESESESEESEVANEVEEGNFISSESQLVAAKINDMLTSEFPVYLGNGGTRPCEKRDFCILLRNRSSAGMFSAALEKHGIKSHKEEAQGYLKSREISVLLNLLYVIDNPLLDIPLVSVLMSPMFMLTSQDVARLRLYAPRVSFYQAILTALEQEPRISDISEPFLKKSDSFIQMLKSLRYLSSSYSLEKLIRTIYDNTDFLSVVQVYKDGEQKKANLRLLMEYARGYETNMGGGLSGFIWYINAISSQGGDFGKANTGSQSENVVMVKTIHKSKGLEFPFVFLCQTSKCFNFTDQNLQMQLNLTSGIGFKIQEKKTLKRYLSLPYVAIREKNRRNMISEEMRLLYVALTRAKEKLFITIDVDDKEANMDTLLDYPQSVRCFKDWLLYCISDTNKLDKIGATVTRFTDEQLRRSFDTQSSNSVLSTKAVPNFEQVEWLKRELKFSYDRSLSVLPAKLTVSEITKNEEAISDMVALRKPFFAINKKSSGGAEKGTATHLFMQRANLNTVYADPEKERDYLVSMGLLSENDGALVDIDSVRSFFSNPLYHRICMAKSVEREKKFLVRIADMNCTSSELEADYSQTDGMLQGIADLIFEEEDGYVLVDYKTDFMVNKDSLRISLREKYSKQLLLYKLSLEQIYDKNVKEVYIYSFILNECVEINHVKAD